MDLWKKIPTRNIHLRVLGMKVSEHAAQNNVGHRADWNRFKHFQIEGAHKDASGHAVVPDRVVENLASGAVHPRGSTRRWKDGLKGRAERMVAFTNAAREHTPDPTDFPSICCSFAARLYGLRSAGRGSNQVAEAPGVLPEETAEDLK